MRSVPQDPFVLGASDLYHHDVHHPAYDTYDYVDAWATVHHPNYQPELILGGSFRCGEWRLVSAAPDAIMTFGLAPSYSSSNGLRSSGDLIRVGPRSQFKCDPSLIGT